jgi:hypothetical protein
LAQDIMTDQSSGDAAEPGKPGPVMRLTFEYDGNDIRLVSRQQVQMIVPPSHPLDQPADAGGFHVLVRNAQDQLLFRQARTSPLKHDTEVFSAPGSDRTIERVAAARPKGAFVVLVPELPGAKTLEFVGPPPHFNTLSAARPQSLGRFDLDQAPRR